jgi:hypothetical protein
MRFHGRRAFDPSERLCFAGLRDRDGWRACCPSVVVQGDGPHGEDGQLFYIPTRTIQET